MHLDLGPVRSAFGEMIFPLNYDEKSAGYGDRTRFAGFPKLVMARDFWRQALHPQRVSTARKSTGVLAVPLSSTRVLETFWTR